MDIFSETFEVNRLNLQKGTKKREPLAKFFLSCLCVYTVIIIMDTRKRIIIIIKKRIIEKETKRSYLFLGSTGSRNHIPKILKVE